MGCCGDSKSSKKGFVDAKDKEYDKDCPVHSVMSPEKITEEDLKNCICDNEVRANLCSSCAILGWKLRVPRWQGGGLVPQGLAPERSPHFIPTNRMASHTK